MFEIHLLLKFKNYQPCFVVVAHCDSDILMTVCAVIGHGRAACTCTHVLVPKVLSTLRVDCVECGVSTAHEDEAALCDGRALYARSTNMFWQWNALKGNVLAELCIIPERNLPGNLTFVQIDGR